MSVVVLVVVDEADVQPAVPLKRQPPEFQVGPEVVVVVISPELDEPDELDELDEPDAVSIDLGSQALPTRKKNVRSERRRIIRSV